MSPSYFVTGPSARAMRTSAASTSSSIVLLSAKASPSLSAKGSQPSAVSRAWSNSRPTSRSPSSGTRNIWRKVSISARFTGPSTLASLAESTTTAKENRFSLPPSICTISAALGGMRPAPGIAPWSAAWPSAAPIMAPKGPPMANPAMLPRILPQKPIMPHLLARQRVRRQARSREIFIVDGRIAPDPGPGVRLEQIPRGWNHPGGRRCSLQQGESGSTLGWSRSDVPATRRIRARCRPGSWPSRRATSP